MSSRAIRALRGDQLLPPAIPDAIDEDDSDENSDDGAPTINQPGVFAFLEDDVTSDEESDQDQDIESLEEPKDDWNDCEESKTANQVHDRVKDNTDDDVETPKEEDLDLILAEFQIMDESAQKLEEERQKSDDSLFDVILEGFESRHLDYDFVMRTSATLHGNISSTHKRPVSFGTAHSDWKRPSRLIGGGIGMHSYQQNPRQLPYPYDSIEDQDDGVEWFTFVYSDTVERDIQDFSSIQQSGDLNTLGMFIVHHPYVPEALLQYSLILYQTNRCFEGMSLLKRCLYLFESSALASFWERLGNGKVCFMDYGQRENQHFFRAVFRLMQVSHIAGLYRTALASCRLLLALDPLRDPMGVLLILDRQALAVANQAIDISEQKAVLQWLVDLVESNLIRLHYKDKSLPHSNVGSLLDLSNWAYSYPLALFLLAGLERLDGDDEDVGTRMKRADNFLKEAMLRFPSVIPSMLRNLEIDISGRSFQRDWVKVLDFAESRTRDLKRSWQAATEDAVNLSAVFQTMERVEQIFVTNPSKQWATEDVIQWFFDTLQNLAATDGDLSHKLPSSPCIMRYSDVKVSDFEARNELLPADVNVMDPNVVAGVMAPMQGGRQRFLRRNQQQNMALEGGNGRRQHPFIFGPPRNAIDLDWPVAEVFWRSFLPWNYVEGLPPPR